MQICSINFHPRPGLYSGMVTCLAIFSLALAVPSSGIAWDYIENFEDGNSDGWTGFEFGSGAGSQTITV